jgi:hypothetical protein
MSIDHSLIHQARKYVTGANVHSVKTWIFCYETSAPDSARRLRYERLLRDFVASRRRIETCRLNIQAIRERLERAGY